MTDPKLAARWFARITNLDSMRFTVIGVFDDRQLEAYHKAYPPYEWTDEDKRAIPNEPKR